MRKLRILIITWYYPPIVGGVETVAKIFTEELSKRRNFIRVLTSGYKEAREKFRNLEIIRTPYMLPSNNSKKFLDYLKRILEEDFDIVHCHNLSFPFNPKKSLTIINICNKLGIPVIEHCHNAQLKTPYKTRKIIHSNIKKIICVSNFVKKRLIKLGIESEKLEVVYNPIDTKLFNLYKINKKEAVKLRKEISPLGYPIIFFPGRIIRISKLEIGKQKQFKIVVKALKILKRKGINFQLAILSIQGQPNSTKETEKIGERLIKKYLTKEGINFFIFKKSLQVGDMPLAYYVSDIVCMPSLNETFGMVFVEAQAIEKPIIAAKSGAVQEVINNKAGFLIEPGNAKQLSLYLEKLIINKKLRKKMGLEGRRVIKMFSKKRLLKKILKIYFDAIERNKIYLVRHPETIHNKENRKTGWEITDYTEKGKKQFKKIVKYFAGKKETVYSSDLPRCLMLAREIAKENKSRIIKSKLLRERNFEDTKPLKYFEDTKEFSRRIYKFLKVYKPKKAIIVTHAGVIEEFLQKFEFKKIKNRIFLLVNRKE